MKKQIPIWPVIGVAIVIVAAAAYMVLVRPKRAESGRLDEQIAEMQMKVSAAQLASRPQQQATTIKVADEPIMPTGSKYKFSIPSYLSYGDGGSPPKIPGHSALVFEVELLSIE